MTLIGANRIARASQMTLHRALIWGMEKGRGQEALARSLTPHHRNLSRRSETMAVAATIAIPCPCARWRGPCIRGRV
jgi:hypothetical protein